MHRYGSLASLALVANGLDSDGHSLINEPFNKGLAANRYVGVAVIEQIFAHRHFAHVAGLQKKERKKHGWTRFWGAVRR